MTAKEALSVRFGSAETLAALLSLLSGIEEKQGLFVLAIDGMCGAGKTTLAELLSARCGAPVIHADDFFLPPELRSAERLSEPGGNIHYERFLAEIVTPLCREKEGTDMRAEGKAEETEPFLSYRRFSCAEMDYLPAPVRIPRAKLVLVEGSYCMRPEFRAAYDASVFLRCTEETQRVRILRRNGAERLSDFETRWIPMENRYFAACGTENACTFCLYS